MREFFDGRTNSAYGVAGGLIGGLAASAFVVGVVSLIKLVLAFVISQSNFLMLLAPFVGIFATVTIIYLIAGGRAALPTPVAQSKSKKFMQWLQEPSSAVRADLTADVVKSAGREEEFPWRVAPLRALAIIFTVGSGAPMGTESPAAHLGVAAGSAVGGFNTKFKPVARFAGLAGGSAGIAVLLGLPLVGILFMFELGRRKKVAVTFSRLLASTLGAAIGWIVNVWFGLDFINLIEPGDPPQLGEGISIVFLVGAISGALGAILGFFVHLARAWQVRPALKFLVGGAILALSMLAIGWIASPQAAVGPGAGTMAWAESGRAPAAVIFVVAALRVVSTVGAVTAGGMGGLFVPLIAIGDLAGRVVAAWVGVSGTLPASAGAAGAIAGGYRLPLSAIALVVTLPGSIVSKLIAVATVVVAVVVGSFVEYLLSMVAIPTE